MIIMARISDKETRKIKSFLFTLEHNLSATNLITIDEYWYDFLVELYQGFDAIDRLTDIPFYHHSLYKEYKEIYDNIMKKKPFRDTTRKWNFVMPMFKIRNEIQGNINFPCIIFPLSEKDTLIEFLREEDNKIISTLPLDSYSYLKKSQGIISDRQYLGILKENGKVKVINSVRLLWKDIVLKGNKEWFNETIEVLLKDVGIKAKGYVVSKNSDLDELLEFLGEDIDRVLLMEMNSNMENGYKIIRR